MDFSFLRPDVPWFAVFADTAASRPAVDRLRASATGLREVTHASGRPWLLGRWKDGAMLVAGVRHVRVALIGESSVAADELAAYLADVRTVADFDLLSGRLAGSAHLVASVGARVRVQGTLSGLRRIFSGRVGSGSAGVPVAADRSDVVAALAGAGVDESALSVRLLSPEPPWPLAWRSAWRTVDALPPDSYLVLDAAGGHGETQWWHRSADGLSLADGALAFRGALTAAVQVRTRRAGLVTCDLSGMDSASLCSLAVREQARVRAFTIAAPDPLHDDVAWATRTALALGLVDHEILAHDASRLPYARIAGTEAQLDEPFIGLIESALFSDHMRQIAGHNPTAHLWGMGGDEVAAAVPTHLHGLFRTRPIAALRLARGYAAKCRMPVHRLVRQAADRRTYRQWLADAANAIRPSAEPATADPDPLDLYWSPPLAVPPWMTPDAVDEARTAVRAAAATAVALGAERGTHTERTGLHLTAAITRQFTQLAAERGVPLAAPYLDDRVCEAGFAVRPEEKLLPSRFKPLLVDAMRGITPDATLARTTKAEASAARILGMSTHRDQLLMLADDSRLAKLGIVDGAKLREVCRRPISNISLWGMLDTTLAVEGWLRAVERRA
jgi:asparagine synthase (glutamine-hydrolysing)